MRLAACLFPNTPWWPFLHTHEDFLLSEFILESGLNNELPEKLFKLINLCISEKGTLTVSS
jgi:hypothetical protein